MMKKLTLLSLFLLFTAALSGQNELNIEKIMVINYGDGRLLFRNAEDETPLEGEHRIIDGYHSAYMLAEFKGGFFDGRYRAFIDNKLVSEGEYKDGLENGGFIDYFTDGKVHIRRTLKNGKIDGICFTYDENGNVVEEKGFKEGVEDGVDKLYRNGELVRDGFYADGKLHGVQDEYFSSNRKNFRRISEFDHGVPTGKYSETLDDGIVRLEGAYKNGKKHGKWITRREDNGILQKEESFTDGQLDRTTVVYFTDGTIEKESEYQAGKLHGVEKTYFWDTGALKTEYMYENGKRHGPYKIRYDNGTIHEDGECEDDKEVFRRKFRQDGTMTDQQRRTRTGWETVD